MCDLTYLKFHLPLFLLRLVNIIHWIHILPTITSLLYLICLVSFNITSWYLLTLSRLWWLIHWLRRGLFNYSISRGRTLWVISCLLSFCYFNLRSGNSISCFCDIFLLIQSCERHLLRNIFAGLQLSFDSSVALIFTPITNLLLCEWPVSATGKFTGNIKGPVPSRNRCKGYQLLLTALHCILTCHVCTCIKLLQPD